MKSTANQIGRIAGLLLAAAGLLFTADAPADTYGGVPGSPRFWTPRSIEQSQRLDTLRRERERAEHDKPASAAPAAGQAADDANDAAGQEAADDGGNEEAADEGGDEEEVADTDADATDAEDAAD